MPAERFYLNEPNLEADTLAYLENEEFHHLTRVMRVKEGETIELVNGKGTLAKACLKSIEKRSATLQITSSEYETPFQYKLVLAQAITRLPKLEWIIEKSVELGATEIWLFPGVLSEKKELSKSQNERINHITVSAMKQCGRLYLPEIALLPPLMTWSKSIEHQDAFFGDIDPLAPHLIESLSAESTSSLIAIGPEKGFHENETLHMKNTLCYKGVKLHKNILRAETAAVCSLSLLSSYI